MTLLKSLAVAAFTLLTLPQLAAEPLNREEVIARSIEALGGASDWNVAETLRATGTFATFSSAKPFTLLRKRPDLYRFEHQQADMEVTVGFDGDTVWWENKTPFSEVDWPMAAPLAYSRGYRADAEFAPPYFRHDEPGYEVTFGGRTDFESLDVYELSVHLPYGLTETWYLDAETFLPAARISRAGFKDFETENRVFFSDYRPAGGLILPHHVESEIDNLVTVMSIDAVEVGVDLPDVLFRMPLPPALEALQFLAGSWDVMVETRPLPGMPWIRSEAQAVITPRFDGRVLDEEISFVAAGTPRSFRRTVTYDRFRDRLRIVHVDDLTAHPILLEGPFSPGRFEVSNLATGTGWTLRGQTLHDRQVFHELAGDRFRVDLERSLDGGAHWLPVARFEYRRQESDPGAPR